MKAKKIREMLGLTVPQAADELNIPRQDLMDGEENEEAYLLARYIAVFPVNPEILSNPQATPFLPSYVAGTPGSRMRAWREENGISAAQMAAAIGVTEETLAAFEAGSEGMSRARGEAIEKATGMNRKWLMFGDGREKGTPVQIAPAKGRRRQASSAPGTSGGGPNRENGQRLKAARLEAGMTREKLAEAAGLSVSRIVQMESGYLREDRLEQMLRLLEMPGKEEPDRKAYGRRIRDARKAAGLSVREAAELAGLQHTSLAHLESGYVTERRAEELEALFLQAGHKRAFSPKEAGIRIRDARKAAGLSQKELATILRITPGAVSAIELGDVTQERAETILRRIGGEGKRPQGAVKRVRRTDQVLLGSGIRDARTRAGMSQKELAELLGVSQGKISLMERGRVDSGSAREILAKIEEEGKKKAKKG